MARNRLTLREAQTALVGMRFSDPGLANRLRNILTPGPAFHYLLTGDAAVYPVVLGGIEAELLSERFGEQGLVGACPSPRPRRIEAPPAGWDRTAGRWLNGEQGYVRLPSCAGLGRARRRPRGSVALAD